MASGVAVFATAIGPCGIAWSADGICAVLLPERSETATRDRLLARHPGVEVSTPPTAAQSAMERIGKVLAGEPDDLRDVPVDFGAAPEFSRQVWELTRSVTPGHTTTYGDIATRLGYPHASREVGQALGRNPVPVIVPCHRVLGAGGKLVGFSAPGGVGTKLRLLAIEGAEPNGQPALF